MISVSILIIPAVIEQQKNSFCLYAGSNFSTERNKNGCPKAQTV